MATVVAGPAGRRAGSSSDSDAKARRVCPTCGSCVSVDTSARRVVKRGALVMRSDPPEFEWRDQFIPLSGLELTLLAAVMVRGRASWEELDPILSLGESTKKVLVHRIRAKFRKMGAQDPFETLAGWGLKLRVEPDANGSRATWIGADEGSERLVHDGASEPGWRKVKREDLEWAGLLARPGRQSGRSS